MAETTGSTVPRLQLGRYLRELRGRERLTVKAAAEKLEWSEAKIWRIETGQTSLRSLDVEAMCQIYAAPADLTEALMGLARETKARGWWHAYGDVIPEGFDVYIGLEEAASELRLVPIRTRPRAPADRGLRADADPGRQPRRGPGGDQPPGPRPDGTAAADPPRHRAPAPAGRAQREHPAAPCRRPGGHGQPARQPGRGVGTAERLAAGRPVPRRAAPGADVRPVRHPAVPAQRGRPRKRARHRIHGRLHRRAVPGQTRRGRAVRRARSAASGTPAWTRPHPETSSTTPRRNSKR